MMRPTKEQMADFEANKSTKKNKSRTINLLLLASLFRGQHK